MKTSKRTRDGAILLASVLASTPEAKSWPDEDIHASLRISKAAYELWWEAWKYAWLNRRDQNDFRCFESLYEAEAEALLREGWEPGEPVLKFWK